MTPSVADIDTQLDNIAEQLKQQVIGGFGTEFQNDNRSGGFNAAHSKANEVVNSAWVTSEQRRAILPVKVVLSRLSRWAQERYGVSFGPMTIVRSIKIEEIPIEIANILRAIENENSLAIMK